MGAANELEADKPIEDDRGLRGQGLTAADKLEIERWSNEAAALIRGGMRPLDAWAAANKPLPDDGVTEEPPAVLSDESREDEAIQTELRRPPATEAKEEDMTANSAPSIAERVFDALKAGGPAPLGQLVEKTKLPLSSVSSSLNQLRKRGQVAKEEGYGADWKVVNGAASTKPKRERPQGTVARRKAPSRAASIPPDSDDLSAPLKAKLELLEQKCERLRNAIAELEAP